MRARFLTTVILLLLAVCVILCGCGIFSSPLGKAEVPNQPSGDKIRIYICGAVEHEGYYYAEVGTDYVQVLRLAGLLPESVPPILNSSYVDGSINVIIVNYYDGGTQHVSINANSVLIVNRGPVDGLSEDVVNKLADYIEAHGKIANKNQLLQALGDDYYANYYKIFISEEDYER